MDNPLIKGMPNTVTLSTGDVVYDLKGEWDAEYYNDYFGTKKGIVKITQDGNKFVGISLINNEFTSKGDETIKGALEKGGFKSVLPDKSSRLCGPASTCSLCFAGLIF